jgi:nuclear pore complex protein Nup107
MAKRMETPASDIYPRHERLRPTFVEWLVTYDSARYVCRTGIPSSGYTNLERTDPDELLLLRKTYLPESILAYISTLQVAGRLLSRDLIMECMDLSSLIADEGSDLLELFVASERVGELVTFFAQAGQELLIVTSQKTSQSKSKKLRSKGWTPELWSVKL